MNLKTNFSKRVIQNVFEKVIPKKNSRKKKSEKKEESKEKDLLNIIQKLQEQHELDRQEKQSLLEQIQEDKNIMSQLQQQQQQILMRLSQQQEEFNLKFQQQNDLISQLKQGEQLQYNQQQQQPHFLAENQLPIQSNLNMRPPQEDDLINQFVFSDLNLDNLNNQDVDELLNQFQATLSAPNSPFNNQNFLFDPHQQK